MTTIQHLAAGLYPAPQTTAGSGGLGSLNVPLAVPSVALSSPSPTDVPSDREGAPIPACWHDCCRIPESQR